MKKLVLTLVLGVFAFGASGFKTYNANNNETDCMMLQHLIFAIWYNSGAGSDQAWEQSITFYESCESNN